MAESHWDRRPEGGGRFALWLIRAIVLRLGRPVGRLLLYPITAYFLIRRGDERRASLAYLARALGRRPTLLDAARHIHCFAAATLDRPLLLTEQLRRFQVQVHDIQAVHAQMEGGQGVMLLGAHLGSFEALRVLSLQRPDVKVAVLLERGQNPAITRLLDELNPQLACSVIDLGLPATELMLKIKEAAEQGALIGFMGDRRRRGEPGMQVDFLGAPAWFPTAPYLIATALKLPVCLCFGLYRGGRRYDLQFEPFAHRIELPRAQREQALAAQVQRFAARLEHHARQAPFNWFNFYDFWSADDATAPARRGPAAVPAADAAEPGRHAAG